MQAITHLYLKLIPYFQFDLWDTKRYTSKSISSIYDVVYLGNCIKEENKKYKLFEEENKEFGILGVNNKTGIFDAYLQKGKDINQAYKKMEIGWLAYNPYRINVGSIGVRLTEHKNEYISPAYVVFSCKSNIMPEYLFLLFKTDIFNKVINESTTGSVRQNLTIDILKKLKVPLPSIKEQKILIDNYYKEIQKADYLAVKENNLERDIEKYFFSILGIDERKDYTLKKGLNFIENTNLAKWSLNHINKEIYDFESAKFKTERLKNLLTFFAGGKTPSKSRNDFWDGNIYWTSPKDFNGRIAIEKAEDKITQLAVKEAGMKVYPKGIILSVFRSGILQHSFPTAITQIETAINQDLKAYSLKEDLIDKKYYLYFVHTFKKYILSLASKKSVTVESINTEDFFEIPIPLPPIDIQREISNKITRLRSEIDDLKSEKIKLEHTAGQQFEKAIFN